MYSMSFRIFFALFLITVVQGCNAIPLTPSQSAQQFWSAVLADDLETAGRFATPQSVPELQSLQKDLRGAIIRFGEVQISSGQASIETSLEIAQADRLETTKFTTHLKREETDWRVDLAQTKQSLDSARERRGMQKLADELQKLGRDVTDQLGHAMKELKKMQPELQRELKSLGESVQKDMQGAIEKYGPEIEQKLKELTESLDGALKELGKAVPQQKAPAKEEQPQGRMI